MNLKAPINENYAGTIVEIKTLIPLEGCDNVVHANIFGNLVVVSKDTKVGDKGVYFPVETRLSNEYLSANNLYRDNTKNANVGEKGYFDDNGRIRCVKFRGHRSQGLVMPLNSLFKFAEIADLATLKVGDVFDNLNGIKICEKYVIPTAISKAGAKNQASKPKESRVVEGQFRFHSDTSHLGKNIHKIYPNTIISITNKLHGTSFVVSKVLVKRKLKWYDKILKFFGAQFVETKYDMIYSSRKVIKNDTNKTYNHYYKMDVWELAANFFKDYMPDGMTIYGELLGYTPDGTPIQKGYDYGCDRGATKHAIYRITYTNWAGQTFEFSAKQVQQWCKYNGLNAVPEYFYGKAKEILPDMIEDSETLSVYPMELSQWQTELLEKLQNSYNMEKDCELCKNAVPAEGIVVRVEALDYEAYKLKAFRFSERETKELDKGVVDIETSESE